MSTDHVFVYGTLKAGLRNAHVNRGQRVGGAWETVQPHWLWLVGPQWLPWLRPQADAAAPAGAGLAVRGEVYAVDGAALAAMDALEQLDEAGWYERVRIEVVAADGAVFGTAPERPRLRPWVYIGSAAGLQRQGVRAGPLAAFGAEHDARAGHG